MVTIAVETPLQDDVRRMVAMLNETLLALTPREFCHHLTVEQMAGPDTTLFIARDDGKAVAMGALKRHGGGMGEVKRMYTIPDRQGAGLGGRILGEIEGLARREGLNPPGAGNRQQFRSRGACLCARRFQALRPGAGLCPIAPYRVF